MIKPGYIIIDIYITNLRIVIKKIKNFFNDDEYSFQKIGNNYDKQIHIYGTLSNLYTDIFEDGAPDGASENDSSYSNLKSLQHV